MICTNKSAQDSINTTLSLFTSFLTCSGFGLCKINGNVFSKKSLALDGSIIEHTHKKKRKLMYFLIYIKGAIRNIKKFMLTTSFT